MFAELETLAGKEPLAFVRYVRRLDAECSDGAEPFVLALLHSSLRILEGRKPHARQDLAETLFLIYRGMQDRAEAEAFGRRALEVAWPLNPEAPDMAYPEMAAWLAAELRNAGRKPEALDLLNQSLDWARHFERLPLWRDSLELEGWQNVDRLHEDLNAPGCQCARIRRNIVNALQELKDADEADGILGLVGRSDFERCTLFSESVTLTVRSYGEGWHYVTAAKPEDWSSLLWPSNTEWPAGTEWIVCRLPSGGTKAVQILFDGGERVYLSSVDGGEFYWDGIVQIIGTLKPKARASMACTVAEAQE